MEKKHVIVDDEKGMVRVTLLPRYIDVDKAVKHLRVDSKAKYPLSYDFGLSAAANEVEKMPTGAVVPMSECKRCGEKAREAIESLQGQIANAKAEVEGYRHNWQKIHDSYIADCAEHYARGRSEVAREIFEEIEDVLNHIGYFDELDFNTLKKKYTGGENNEV